MSKAKRREIPNADLVQAVRNHRNQILKYHEQLEDSHSVILLDFQRRKLRAYPYVEYRAMLRQDSRPKLDAEYKNAVTKNKVLVLVWDSATRRLVTTTLRHG